MPWDRASEERIIALLTDMPAPPVIPDSIGDEAILTSLQSGNEGITSSPDEVAFHAHLLPALLFWLPVVAVIVGTLFAAYILR